jgi:hypothetical protein
MRFVPPSALHSLRLCRTGFLSILRECFPVVPHVGDIAVLTYQNSLLRSLLDGRRLTEPPGLGG